MQRSRRGYKLHRPHANRRHDKSMYVRVDRADKHDIKVNSFGVDPAANLTVEQFEDWREKIKRDK